MNKFSPLSPSTCLSIFRWTGKVPPLALGTLALAAASGISDAAPPVPTGERLRDLGDTNNIRVGAAIWNYDWNDPANDDFETVAKREFSFFTSENEMKIGATQLEQGQFEYTNGQRIVNLANSANGKVHGHTLVWWASLPEWITNGSWTATSLTNVMNNHIDNVATQWPNDVVVWDVVNESFRSHGQLGPNLTWQQSLHPAGKDLWNDIIGSTYIEKAFQRARAAAPNAVLIYNDFEIEGQNYHSSAVFKMVEDFQNRGIPIDGIGAQMHLGPSTTRPGASMRPTFDRYAKLGLKTYITEFDCHTRILVPNPDGSGSFVTAPDSSPPSLFGLDNQARAYHDALDMALRTPGFSGFQTWGMRNKPGIAKLLFSLPGLEPLPSYYAVQDALSYQQRDELIANGLVEDATLSPWSGNANGTSTIAATTASYHSGAKSILVSGRSASSAGPGQNVTTKLLDQGSGRYYLRAWMRTASGTGTGKLTLRLQDDAGTHYLGVSKSISSSWTEVSGWVNVKWFKELSSAVLYAETPGSTGNFYLDDVTLSDGNLLKNNGFGDGATTSWSTYVGGSISNASSDTNLDLVYKYGRNGGYVTGRTAAFHGPVQNITAAMLASGPGTYEVSAWVKLKKPSATTSATGEAKITIRANSGAGMVYKGTTSTAISSEKWTKVSGTLNVTWSDILSDARLYVETPGTTASFYVDEIIARRGSSGTSVASPAFSPPGPSSNIL